jgi:hypothetical protein
MAVDGVVGGRGDLNYGWRRSRARTVDRLRNHRWSNSRHVAATRHNVARTTEKSSDITLKPGNGEMTGTFKKFVLAALAAIGVSGCAGVTDVVSTGPDSYMVASHGTMGWSSGPAQKAAAFEKADAYCEERGKAVQVIKASDSGSGAFGIVGSIR